MIRTVVVGAAGRMGRMLVAHVMADADLELCGALEAEGSPLLGQDAAAVAGLQPCGVPITADAQAAFANADAVIDFTPGIHIGTDGSEGGYAIFNISGADFKWQYKPLKHDVNYQFRTYDRNEIQITAEKYIPNALEANKTKFEEYAKDWTNHSNANEVYINIWNYDPSWKIEVTENGKSLTATKVSISDPLHLIAYTAPAINNKDSEVNPSFATSSNSHTWKVTASSATSTLDIKVTDRFGNVYSEKMERPKAFTIDTYK